MEVENMGPSNISNSLVTLICPYFTKGWALLGSYISRTPTINSKNPRSAQRGYLRIRDDSKDWPSSWHGSSCWSRLYTDTKGVGGYDVQVPDGRRGRAALLDISTLKKITQKSKVGAEQYVCVFFSGWKRKLNKNGVPLERFHWNSDWLFLQLGLVITHTKGASAGSIDGLNAAYDHML